MPDPCVEAIAPYVSPQIITMVRLQQLTGMRPGEVAIMRSCDIDMTSKVWGYMPSTYKTEHFEEESQEGMKIWLGPQAQEILQSFLKGDPQAYIFSPTDAETTRNARRRLKRKTPLWPSHGYEIRRRRLGGGAPEDPPG